MAIKRRLSHRLTRRQPVQDGRYFDNQSERKKLERLRKYTVIIALRAIIQLLLGLEYLISIWWVISKFLSANMRKYQTYRAHSVPSGPRYARVTTSRAELRVSPRENLEIYLCCGLKGRCIDEIITIRIRSIQRWDSLSTKCNCMKSWSLSTSHSAVDSRDKRSKEHAFFFSIH